MKEYKFRAWSLLSKAYIDLWNIPFNEIFCKTPDTRPLIIEQYTGLKDKKGKDIYEGDICSGGQFGNFTVEWDSHDTGYHPFTSPGYGGYEWDHENSEDVEVIGNIHENPELIKK